MTHPALASILYLTDLGGPTLVLPVSTTATGEWRDAAARDSLEGGCAHVEAMLKGVAYASHPLRDRWVTFQGDLLHGVVPNPWPKEGAEAHVAGGAAGGESKRVTLLVNWWWEKVSPGFLPRPPPAVRRSPFATCRGAIRHPPSIVRSPLPSPPLPPY